MRTVEKYTLVSLVLCLGACRGGDAASVHTLPAVAAGTHASQARYQPAFYSENHRQALGVSEKRSFVLKDRRRSSATQSWDTNIYAFGAQFEILRVVSSEQAPDRFYLQGLGDNGDQILEYWKRRPVSLSSGDGGYYMKRTELYRGKALGTILTFGLDLSDGYLLVVHDHPTKVSKLSLPEGTPEVVFDTTHLPALDFLRGAESVYPRHHKTEGVIWIARMYRNTDPTIPGLPRALLYDFNLDGEFDSWAGPIYEEDWDSMGYDQDVWH